MGDRRPENFYTQEARAVARAAIPLMYEAGRAAALGDMPAPSDAKQRLPIPWRFAPKDGPAADTLLRAVMTLPLANQRVRELRDLEARHLKEKKQIESQLADLSNVAAWWDQRPDMAPAKESAVRRILDAAKKNRSTFCGDVSADELCVTLDGDPQVFLIQHDWDAAFRNADGLDCGALRLPYEACVFEMVAARRHVALVATQADDDSASEIGLLVCVATATGRWVVSRLSLDDKDSIIVRQVRAVLIALDAGMAVAAEATARQKPAVGPGKTGYAVHVVSVRPTVHRATQAAGGAGSKRRLHFRRGHWRQYQSGLRSWVRWCLVGDPDLGFIEKEYRL